MLTVGQKDFLASAGPAAVAAESPTGVPALLCLCQAIEESGWGRHAPQFNLFGIKSTPGQLSQLLSTHEYFTPEQAAAFVALGAGREAILVTGHAVNGRDLYNCLDLFAAYPDLTAAFQAHNVLISQGAYFKAAFAQYQDDQDFPALVRNVAEHYATAPNYADAILAISRMPDVQAAIQEARG